VGDQRRRGASPRRRALGAAGRACRWRARSRGVGTGRSHAPATRDRRPPVRCRLRREPTPRCRDVANRRRGRRRLDRRGVSRDARLRDRGDAEHLRGRDRVDPRRSRAACQTHDRTRHDSRGGTDGPVAGGAASGRGETARGSPRRNRGVGARLDRGTARPRRCRRPRRTHDRRPGSRTAARQHRRRRHHHRRRGAVADLPGLGAGLRLGERVHARRAPRVGALARLADHALLLHVGQSTDAAAGAASPGAADPRRSCSGSSWIREGSDGPSTCSPSVAPTHRVGQSR
jgi:hypothetical protein